MIVYRSTKMFRHAEFDRETGRGIDISDRVSSGTIPFFRASLHWPSKINAISTSRTRSLQKSYKSFNDEARERSFLVCSLGSTQLLEDSTNVILSLVSDCCGGRVRRPLLVSVHSCSFRKKGI